MNKYIDISFSESEFQQWWNMTTRRCTAANDKWETKDFKRRISNTLHKGKSGTPFTFREKCLHSRLTSCFVEFCFVWTWFDLFCIKLISVCNLKIFLFEILRSKWHFFRNTGKCKSLLSVGPSSISLALICTFGDTVIKKLLSRILVFCCLRYCQISNSAISDIFDT